MKEKEKKGKWKGEKEGFKYTKIFIGAFFLVAAKNCKQSRAHQMGKSYINVMEYYYNVRKDKDDYKEA